MIGKILTGTVAIITIISAGTLAYGKLHTDYEALHDAVANAEARTAIVSQHTRDIATVLDKFDNDRIERADREITKIDYSLQFDKLTEEEKEFKRSRRKDLEQLKKDIRGGLR